MKDLIINMPFGEYVCIFRQWPCLHSVMEPTQLMAYAKWLRPDATKLVSM